MLKPKPPLFIELAHHVPPLSEQQSEPDTALMPRPPPLIALTQ